MTCAHSLNKLGICRYENCAPKANRKLERDTPGLRRMLIATAGHVDHGKTSLVRALTGVDTDRLPEEKARGLTIDLGFAYQTLDSGAVLGFVDVPGHERFIRNMIAGVPAIDFALLVVAADDGPMPQTVEHLAILDLLGVSAGAVVITKIDRVEAARVEQVRDDIAALLLDSNLHDAPMFAVAAIDGTGMDALREHLGQAAAALAPAKQYGGFRFAVDRSFSVHGAGLVATGAVYAGSVRIGDRLILAGHDLEVRVRGMESAGKPVDVVHSGMRCALNLAGRGVSANSVSRGDWVVALEAGPVNDRLDVSVRLLPSESAPLKQWTPVHVHHGAAFVTARITLPGGEAIKPGQHGLAQIVTDRPLCAVHGERLVLRDTTGRRTLGGATVIDPYAPRRVRDRPGRLRLLHELKEPDIGVALAAVLPIASDGLDPGVFAHARNVARDQILSLAASNGAIAIDTDLGTRLLMPQIWESVQASILAELTRFHDEHPEAVGLAEAQLSRRALAASERSLGSAGVGAMVRAAQITRDGINLRLPTHRARLNAADEALWSRVSAHFDEHTTKPLTSGDLALTLEVALPALLAFLEGCARRGQLVRVSRNRFFHPKAIAHLAHSAQVLALAAGEPGFNARAYRDATAIGRNLSIEVLEFFDAMGLTRRVGETRQLIGDSVKVFGEAAT